MCVSHCEPLSVDYLKLRFSALDLGPALQYIFVSSGSIFKACLSINPSYVDKDLDSKNKIWLLTSEVQTCSCSSGSCSSSSSIKAACSKGAVNL